MLLLKTASIKTLDPDSGVAILLSQRFSKRILAKGAIGSRIVWVRLDGPTCPLFVVCAYIPHKYRTAAPQAADTIADLNCLLTKCKDLKSGDCVIVMGDLNCELERNVQGCTGRWLMNTRPDDGHSADIISLMRSQDLFAVDSMFRPKRRKMFTQKKKRLCNATWLQKDSSLRPKKLDYFLVSNRWRSCVINSKTSWAPSIHRFGRAFDHSLLQIQWSWRIKKEKIEPAKDFKAMTQELWSELNEEIKKRLDMHNKLEHNNPKFEDSPTSENARRDGTSVHAWVLCVPNT